MSHYIIYRQQYDAEHKLRHPCKLKPRGRYICRGGYEREYYFEREKPFAALLQIPLYRAVIVLARVGFRLAAKPDGSPREIAESPVFFMAHKGKKHA